MCYAFLHSRKKSSKMKEIVVICFFQTAVHWKHIVKHAVKKKMKSWITCQKEQTVFRIMKLWNDLCLVEVIIFSLQFSFSLTKWLKHDIYSGLNKTNMFSFGKHYNNLSLCINKVHHYDICSTVYLDGSWCQSDIALNHIVISMIIWLGAQYGQLWLSIWSHSSFHWGSVIWILGPCSQRFEVSLGNTPKAHIVVCEWFPDRRLRLLSSS